MTLATPLVVLDVPVIDAALLPIINAVLAEAKADKLPTLTDEEKGGTDEGVSVAISMLSSLVQYAMDHSPLESINKANIPFSGKPEVDCLLAKKLRVRKRLGSGSFGNVFMVNASTAVKVLRMHNHSPGLDGQRMAFLEDVEMGRKAHKLGVGPKIIDAFVCSAHHNEHHGVIIMALVRGPDLSIWIKTATAAKATAMRAKVEALVQRMHRGALFHNDLHANNIIVTKNSVPMFVDFAFARDSPKQDQRWNLYRAGGKDQRHRDFDVLKGITPGGNHHAWRDNESKHSAGMIIRHVVLRALSSGVLAVHI